MDRLLHFSVLKDIYVNKHTIAISGIHNIGNTCYLSSLIQCLRYTKQFNELFVSDQNINILEKIIQTNLDKQMDQEKYKTELNICLAYIKLLSEINSKSISYNPIELVRLIALNPLFSGGGQQDAHELLIYILDSIHKIYNYPVTFVNTGTPKTIRDFKLKTSFDDYKNYYNSTHSFVLDVFMGQTRNEIISSCGCVAVKYDPLTVFELPVSQTSTSLEDCFKDYLSVEEIEYKCDKNCDGIKSHKHITLWKTPRILIIKLNRFKNTVMGGNIYIEKLMNEIHIPMNFSLESFLDHDSLYKRQSQYKLYAIICHSGSYGSGHYYTINKINDQEWVIFNDNQCSRVNNIDLVSINPENYMLFYERI